MKILGVTPDDQDSENPYDKDVASAAKRARHTSKRPYKEPTRYKFEPPSDEKLIEYVQRSIRIRKEFIDDLTNKLTIRRQTLVALKEEIAEIEKRLLEAEERFTNHMNALIANGLIERHGGQI